jgi:hypothetical protein
MKIIKAKLKKEIHYSVQHYNRTYLVTRLDQGLKIDWIVKDNDDNKVVKNSELWHKLTDYCFEKNKWN